MAETAPEKDKAVKPESVSTKAPKPVEKKKKTLRKASPSSKLSYKNARTFAVSCYHGRATVKGITADNEHFSETIDVGADNAIEITVG